MKFSLGGENFWARYVSYPAPAETRLSALREKQRAALRFLRRGCAWLGLARFCFAGFRLARLRLALRRRGRRLETVRVEIGLLFRQIGQFFDDAASLLERQRPRLFHAADDMRRQEDHQFDLAVDGLARAEELADQRDLGQDRYLRDIERLRVADQA